ncbi:MAG: hypothetical protein CBC15_09285 [Candidatus Endolissoclinum sp. TMED55]|nr:MAG: hypothetical protein CBC15_09285 [Candidatus Endolissoclinum sp. TMED55]
MKDLFTALALVLVIEGVLYALFPSKMRYLISKMTEVQDTSLRTSGILAIFVGVACVWVIRSWSGQSSQ